MDKKVVSAAEAASKIPDGAFIAISGIGVTGTALEVLDAIVERHKKEGHPENLSLIHAGGNQLGQSFAAEGMLRTYYAGLPGLGDYTDGNQVATYTLSQGICTQLYRAQASDVPYLSKAGVRTYLDPRMEASAANAKAREKSIVDLVTIDGEEYLHYKLPPITAAIIRGTSADAEGNLTNEEECFKHELLYLAMAAHNNGGIVIAQVKTWRRLALCTLRTSGSPACLWTMWCWRRILKNGTRSLLSVLKGTPYIRPGSAATKEWTKA